MVLGQTPLILRAFTLVPTRLTATLLPPALRDQYDLSCNPLELTASDVFSLSMRAAVPHLPDALRFFPQYRRARRRLLNARRAA